MSAPMTMTTTTKKMAAVATAMNTPTLRPSRMTTTSPPTWMPTNRINCSNVVVIHQQCELPILPSSSLRCCFESYTRNMKRIERTFFQLITRSWHPGERSRSSRPFCPPPLASVFFSSIYLFMSMYVSLSVCSRREETRRCVSSDSRVRVSTYAHECPMRKTGEGERRYFIACRCSCGLHFVRAFLLLLFLFLLFFLS